MKNSYRHRKSSSAVFDTILLLEKAHICFDIKRLRPDTLTITASIVGERIEIDISKMIISKYPVFAAMKASRADGNSCSKL